MLKFCLLVSFILFINFELSTQFECYVCKEKDFPNQCGSTLNLNGPLTIPTIECDQACVTFKNKYDGGTIVRNCTSGLWVPPTGKYNETFHGFDTCIKDKYSLELFCFCRDDFCNGNNTGSLAIFETNECLSNPCKSNGTCTDLYNAYKCTCPGNFAEPNCATCKPGFTGATCSTPLDLPCVSNPCSNGGTCNDNTTTYTYTCTCPQGFNGSKCEIDIDECLSSPCKNGGVCKDLPGSFSCTCTGTGFEGPTCEDDVDECSSTPCPEISSFNCTNTIGSYKCFCRLGYTGNNCETIIDVCKTYIPCRNSLSCTNNAVPEYTCECIPGYTGKNCTEDIDECASAPCQNGGTCNDLLNNYKCQCVAGYTGKNCEINIDECASSPCVFGNCTDGVNSYTCACKPGYTGTLCETDINECASTPCQNNGKCLDLINMYKCQCLSGFTGINCEDTIYFCTSNPCLYGTCNKILNGYTCTCDPGYTGTFCETDIDECASNPCLNLGTCVNLINAYRCICNTTYYTGKRCERPVNRCFEPEGVEPCNGNGDCFGGIGYQPISCTCFSGYTGQYCETRISVCQSVTCLNGGTCVENSKALNGYLCACADGFTGALCESKMSVCSDLRVNCNSGSCVDIDGGYKCNCFDGYNGEFCTTKYFTCPDIGTFADPLYCDQYYYCSLDSNGKLVEQLQVCSKLGSFQLLFDSEKKNCVLSSRHPNPGCTTKSQ